MKHTRFGQIRMLTLHNERVEFAGLVDTIPRLSHPWTWSGALHLRHSCSKSFCRLPMFIKGGFSTSRSWSGSLKDLPVDEIY